MLVVGAGPAGLEAARALGAKGHDVILAEAGRELGGRVVREAWLPGLAPYIRVRDHREQAFAKLSNVQVFRESRMSAQDVFDVAPQHVVIATGAEWRRDRFDGAAWRAVATGDARPMTPDDIMDGERPEGPVVVFDQDGYVLGGVIAEALAREGLAVNYVTESDSVSAWAGHTTERWRVRARLMELGVEIATAQALTAWDGAEAELVCGYSGAERRVAAAGAVLVTQRIPRDGLYHDLLAEAGGEASALPFTLTRIGDAEAPGLVAQAVHAGRRYAEELGADIDPDAPVRHERPQLEAPVPRRPAAPLAAAAAAETSALHPDYLPTLLRYWEEEIEGEAYFRALAERLPEPREKERMILLAEVERRTAADARPLIDRHGLSPAPEAQLIAAGRAAAAAGPQDWPTLFAEMRRAYPGYVAAFEALEALGPAPDHPLLARMTEHEVCAVAFLEAEAAGAPDATAPLLRFLCVPPVAPAPA
ncbi:MAG: FAD-dependent oxidoreductase [Pseudomonadota bacterium]